MTSTEIGNLGEDIAAGLLEAKGYTEVYPDSIYEISKNVVTLLVKSSCRSCKIVGTVRRQKTFVEGAVVQITGFQVADTTDQNGYFELHLTPEQERADGEYPVTVLLNGEIVWENYIAPTPNVPAEILLQE